MRRRTVLPILILSFLLSGCLTNPNTGRLGPSWETTYRIPLLSQETTLDEFLENDDLQTDPVTGVYGLTVSHETQFNLEPIQVELDPLTLTYPGTGIQIDDIPLGAMTFPLLAGAHSYSETLEISEFTRLSLESGVLEIRTQGTPTAVAVQIWDESGNPLGEAQTAQSPILYVDLAGKTLTQKIHIQVTLTASQSLPDGLEAALVLTEAQVTQASQLSHINTDFEFSGTLSDLPMDWVRLSQGSLSLDLLGLEGITLQINQFSLGAVSSTGLTLDLSGLTLTPQTPILLKGSLTGSNISFDIASIAALARFSNLYITEVKGQIDPVMIDLPDEVINLDLSLLEDLPDLELANITLTLRMSNETGIPLNLSDLAIRSQTDLDWVGLIVADPIHLPGRGVHTVQITPANSNILELVNSRPHAIEFGGRILAGSDVPIEADLTQSIVIALDLNVTADFNLPPTGIPFRLDPLTIEATESDLQILERQAKEVRLMAEVTNGLPVGAEVTILLSSNRDPWSDPGAIRLQTQIQCGVTSTQGFVTAPKQGLIQLSLTGAELAQVLQGGYAGIELQILTNDPHRVALRGHDYIKINAWAELTTQINR